MSRVAANCARSALKSTIDVQFSLNLLFRNFSINMKSIQEISSGQQQKYFFNRTLEIV